MPTAILADDEQHLLDYLGSQLHLLWPELRIVGRALNGIEALRLIDELAPDVVFLDIRMPGLSGIDVAQRLLSGRQVPHIVFVTAYEQYAVQAFEQSASDYLLKPVSAERLLKTVEKLQIALQQPRAQAELKTLLGPAQCAATTDPGRAASRAASRASPTASKQRARATFAMDTRSAR